MSLTLDQVADEAMQLPPASRALLAERMVESLDVSERDEIQCAWAAEAIRRRDEFVPAACSRFPARKCWLKSDVSLGDEVRVPPGKW